MLLNFSEITFLRKTANKSRFIASEKWEERQYGFQTKLCSRCDFNPVQHTSWAHFNVEHCRNSVHPVAPTLKPPAVQVKTPKHAGRAGAWCSCWCHLTQTYPSRTIAHYINCSGVAPGMWQRAYSIHLVLQCPRFKSDWATGDIHGDCSEQEKVCLENVWRALMAPGSWVNTFGFDSAGVAQVLITAPVMMQGDWQMLD